MAVEVWIGLDLMILEVSSNLMMLILVLVLVLVLTLSLLFPPVLSSVPIKVSRPLLKQDVEEP